MDKRVPNTTLFQSKLGTPKSDDVPCTATPDKPALNHVAQGTDDGRYLLVTSSEGTDERYGLALYDLGKRGAKPKQLVGDFANNWEYVGNDGPLFTFLTNKDAPRQRLVAMDIRKPQTLTPLGAQSEQTLVGARSEERGVGNAGVRKGRSRG